MAETSAQLLLTPEGRTSEAAKKLDPFLREAASRTGLSVTMTARDDGPG